MDPAEEGVSDQADFKREAQGKDVQREGRHEVQPEARPLLQVEGVDLVEVLL